MWFLLFQLLTTILDEPTQGLYLERGEVTLTRTRGERKEFVSLLFLQGTESSNISIWLPSPECCPSKQCKDLLLELQSRSMAVKSFYLSLNWLHVILQPWLWLAGSPSDEAYVVRKAKRENGLCCVILENIKTGTLVMARRLVVIVKPGEEFLKRLQDRLVLEETDTGADLSTRVEAGVRGAGGVMEARIDLDRWDIDIGVVSRWRKEVQCTICLAGVKEGEREARLRCGHGFHGECLGGWLGGRRNSCPVCRREVKVSKGSVVGMVEGWVMSGEGWVTSV